MSASEALGHIQTWPPHSPCITAPCVLPGRGPGPTLEEAALNALTASPALQPQPSPNTQHRLRPPDPKHGLLFLGGGDTGSNGSTGSTGRPSTGPSVETLGLPSSPEAVSPLGLVGWDGHKPEPAPALAPAPAPTALLPCPSLQSDDDDHPYTGQALPSTPSSPSSPSGWSGSQWECGPLTAKFHVLLSRLKVQPILEEVLSWRRTILQCVSSTPSTPSTPPSTISDPLSRVSAAVSSPHSPFPSLHGPKSSSGWASPFLFLLLLWLVLPLLVGGSEFPDRECCDNPLYQFEPHLPGHTTLLPPLLTYSPPEVPDYPEYGPPEVPPGPPYSPDKGVLTTTPATGSLQCLLARTLCSEDPSCSQILQVIPRLCGLELVTCSTPTVTKCQAALKTLQSFPFFNPTCLCKEPRLDPDCNQFKDFLVDHPCLNAKHIAIADPFPVDALPTCHHAKDVCTKDSSCRSKVQSFKASCKVSPRGQCTMKNVAKCHGSWQQLRQSPIFGCFCPSHLPQTKRKQCDKVFKEVNGNDCIDAQLPDTLRVVYTNLARASEFWTLWYRILEGSYSQQYPDIGRATRHTVSVDELPKTSTVPYYLPTTVDRYSGGGTSQSDQEVVNLHSTCHTALDSCEKETSCRVYLENVKSRCVESCNRDRCMLAVKEFYRKVPDEHSLDVAFCLCKKNGNDEQCFRAQSILHPECAQTPVDWSREEEDLPSCHLLARECRDDEACSARLDSYIQSCSVDSETKTCSGTYTACRKAMVDILGTDLRTNCACSGTAGDFRELFECIEYHRLFWLNPCVVDAQKDYHINKAKEPGGNTPSWTSGGRATPRITQPPPRRVTTRRPIRRTTSTTTRRRQRPTQPPRTRPVPERTRPPLPSLAPPRPTPPTQLRPVGGTAPWTPHTPPPRTTRLPRRRPSARPTQRGRQRGNVTPKSTAPTTTTTTLPPRYCNLAQENFIDENVKYIREGFEKRLYQDDKEGSQLCGCKANSQLQCTFLEEIERKPCNTPSAFYSHASPFYLAYRGQCLCYSGEFICAKHDIMKGSKQRSKEKPIVVESPPGVFLYLGYSKKDSIILTRGRMKIQDEKNIPSTDEEERNEVKNTIQQTVSHFTSNTNKSDCRINLVDRNGENYILKATLDEFDEYRMKKNMSDFQKWKEKEECFAALQSIAQKVNDRDADMRSHIVLSMFKVAAAEANVPAQPKDAGWSHSPPSFLIICLSLLVCLTTRTS